MLSNRIRGAAALALAAACLPAPAAEVTITGWAFGTGNDVRSTLFKGAAGAFIGTLTGAGAFNASPFTTYCVEATEFFDFGPDPMTGYAFVAGADYFGTARSDALGRLMTYVADDPTRVDSAAESTSLQLAIWNLVYDSDASVTTPGVFRDASAYAAYANVLLAGAQALPTSRFDIDALRKDGSQDFLLVSDRATTSRLAAAALPEPATAALVGTALLALALGRRGRSAGRVSERLGAGSVGFPTAVAG